MLTAEEIYGGLSMEREVTRPHLYSALYRLKKRNMAFKAGKLWGLVGRDDRIAEESAGDSETALVPSPLRISS